MATYTLVRRFSGAALVERDVLDTVASTVTVFDGSGTQVSQRAATSDDLAAAAAIDLSTNATTITANLTNAQATIQAWIAANPSGAVLTAGQTLVVAKMLNGLCKILLSQYSSTSGT